MQIKKIGLLAAWVIFSSCQTKPSDNGNLSAQVEPAACLPGNNNADPTVSNAQSYNLQCTQKYCGSFSRACDASQSQVCTLGICQTCSTDQNACPMAVQGLASQYQAQLSACNNDQTCLPWSCVDFKSDPKNCGACGNVCSASAQCQNATCVTPQSPLPQYLVSSSGYQMKFTEYGPLDSALNSGGTTIVIGPAVKDVGGVSRNPIMTADGKYINTSFDPGKTGTTMVFFGNQFATNKEGNGASLYFKSDGTIAIMFGAGQEYILYGQGQDTFFFDFTGKHTNVYRWQICASGTCTVCNNGQSACPIQGQPATGTCQSGQSCLPWSCINLQTNPQTCGKM